MDEFKKRYKKELAGEPELLKKIKAEARKQTVTLLFSTKELERNNAVALKEMLNQL